MPWSFRRSVHIYLIIKSMDSEYQLLPNNNRFCSVGGHVFSPGDTSDFAQLTTEPSKNTVLGKNIHEAHSQEKLYFRYYAQIILICFALYVTSFKINSDLFYVLFGNNKYVFLNAYCILFERNKCSFFQHVLNCSNFSPYTFLLRDNTSFYGMTSSVYFRNMQQKLKTG